MRYIKPSFFCSLNSAGKGLKLITSVATNLQTHAHNALIVSSFVHVYKCVVNYIVLNSNMNILGYTCLTVSEQSSSYDNCGYILHDSVTYTHVLNVTLYGETSGRHVH